MEAVFRDVVHALRYAYSFNSQQYGKSLMARMYGPPGSGRGLSGIDGAGQAGFILAEVAKLQLVQQAVLFVRYSPSDFPCSCGALCCSKRRPNREWTVTIEWLAEHTAVLFSGCLSNVRLRRVLVRDVLLGEKMDYTALGKQFGVDRHTVAKHALCIKTALIGTRHQKGEFDRAFERADELLREAGIVGEIAVA